MTVRITMFFREETKGRDIFYDDKDRRVFLDALGEMSERFEIEIYAFVLMSNHYHFLLQTKGSNLSRAMQWFGVTYTRRLRALSLTHKAEFPIVRVRKRKFLSHHHPLHAALLSPQPPLSFIPPLPSVIPSLLPVIRLMHAVLPPPSSVP